VHCHTGVWHHAPLISAQAPRREGNHDVESFDVHGAPCRQEFLLLQIPRLEIWVVKVA
jgi:hypothetical protein